MLMFLLFVLVCLRQSIDTIVKALSPLLKTLTCSTLINTKIRKEHELHDLIAQQKHLSMIDEFSKYAKLQRKIDPMKDEISHQTNTIMGKIVMIQTSLRYLFHIITSVMLLYVLYMNRYEPVLTVPSQLVQPYIVSKLVAFPNGIPGNVGCIFWLIICKFVVAAFNKHFVN